MSRSRDRGRSAGADRSQRTRARFAVALAAFGLLSAALAHAYLDTSAPEDFAAAISVEEVVLRFTSDVEPAFSRFELHRLALPDDAWPADPAAPSDTERMRLNALAARALAVDGGDALVAVEAAPARRTPVVTLTPSATLEPGAYVVAYEVLAVDGHTTSGHFLFFVRAD